jgi:hypothetical protein
MRWLHDVPGDFVVAISRILLERESHFLQDPHRGSVFNVGNGDNPLQPQQVKSVRHKRLGSFRGQSLSPKLLEKPVPKIDLGDIVQVFESGKADDVASRLVNGCAAAEAMFLVIREHSLLQTRPRFLKALGTVAGKTGDVRIGYHLVKRI